MNNTSRKNAGWSYKHISTKQDSSGQEAKLHSSHLEFSRHGNIILGKTFFLKKKNIVVLQKSGKDTVLNDDTKDAKVGLSAPCFEGSPAKKKAF